MKRIILKVCSVFLTLVCLLFGGCIDSLECFYYTESFTFFHQPWHIKNIKIVEVAGSWSYETLQIRTLTEIEETELFLDEFYELKWVYGKNTEQFGINPIGSEEYVLALQFVYKNDDFELVQIAGLGTVAYSVENREDWEDQHYLPYGLLPVIEGEEQEKFIALVEKYLGRSIA